MFDGGGRGSEPRRERGVGKANHVITITRGANNNRPKLKFMDNVPLYVNTANCCAQRFEHRGFE